MKTKQNWIDRLVTYIAPKAGANRAKARITAEYYSSGEFKRLYEGASTGRRTEGWVSPSSNANKEIAPALVRLRDRARDLTRNNPLAARAIQVIVSNTIGTGIMAKHRSDSREKDLELDALWSAWANSTSFDLEGRHDFYGFQTLAMRTVVESGEVLVRKVVVPASEESPVPLKLQMLEPDFIDSAKDQKLAGGGAIVQGIEYDSAGSRVAYWLFSEHPGGGGTATASRRVPAEEILHIFRTDRPGQARGVPWAAPVMVRIRDLDDFMDAQLVKMKVSSCLTAFVTDIEAPLDGSAAAATLGEKLEPGQIEILPAGKDIRFASPPGADGSEQFVTETLRMIAAAYGVSFEALTNNYSTVNYSSGRMGWIEMSRNVDAWRWGMVIPQLCVPVWKWFSQAVGLIGGSLDGIRVEWSAPRREMIDPTKEIAASINAVRGGLMSLSEVHRQSGYDSDSVLEEIAADNARLDALGLILDSDARKTMKAGVAQTYIDTPEGETLEQPAQPTQAAST